MHALRPPLRVRRAALQAQRALPAKRVAAPATTRVAAAAVGARAAAAAASQLQLPRLVRGGVEGVVGVQHGGAAAGEKDLGQRGTLLGFAPALPVDDCTPALRAMSVDEISI